MFPGPLVQAAREGQALNAPIPLVTDDRPVCPTCGTGEWDFLVNDDAVCENGHRWTVPIEDDPVDVADRMLGTSPPAATSKGVVTRQPSRHERSKFEG